MASFTPERITPTRRPGSIGNCMLLVSGNLFVGYSNGSYQGFVVCYQVSSAFLPHINYTHETKKPVISLAAYTLISAFGGVAFERKSNGALLMGHDDGSVSWCFFGARCQIQNLIDPRPGKVRQMICTSKGELFVSRADKICGYKLSLGTTLTYTLLSEVDFRVAESLPSEVDLQSKAESLSIESQVGIPSAEISGMCVDESEEYLCIGMTNGNVSIWNINLRRVVCSFNHATAACLAVTTLARGDGGFVAAFDDRTLRMYMPTDGKYMQYDMRPSWGSQEDAKLHKKLSSMALPPVWFMDLCIMGREDGGIDVMDGDSRMKTLSQRQGDTVELINLSPIRSLISMPDGEGFYSMGDQYMIAWKKHSSRFFQKPGPPKAEVDSRPRKESFSPIIYPRFRESSKRIGVGAHGIVSRGSLECAVKKITIRSSRHLEAIKKELMVLDQLPRHHHVVRFYHATPTEDSYNLFFELCNSDMHNTLIASVPPFQRTVDDGWKMLFRQATEGLLHLKNNSIIHRDVKPSNFLLTNTPEPKFAACGGLMVKVCDFDEIHLLGDDTDLRTMVGTPVFMAPEVLHQIPYSFPADVFSFGLTIWAVLIRDGSLDTITKANLGKTAAEAILTKPDELHIHVRSSVSSEFWGDLLRGMMRQEPEQRLTLEEVLAVLE